MPISGVSELRKNLQWRRKNSGAVYANFDIGYTAPYAVFVHENLQMKLRGELRTGSPKNGKPRIYPRYWDASTLSSGSSGQGQAKFLEAPVRENSQKLGQMAHHLVKDRKMTLERATYMVALEILNLSKAVVPYDTGDLYKSGYVKRVGALSGSAKRDMWGGEWA